MQLNLSKQFDFGGVLLKFVRKNQSNAHPSADHFPWSKTLMLSSCSANARLSSAPAGIRHDAQPSSGCLHCSLIFPQCDCISLTWMCGSPRWLLELGHQSLFCSVSTSVLCTLLALVSWVHSCVYPVRAALPACLLAQRRGLEMLSGEPERSGHAPRHSPFSQATPSTIQCLKLLFHIRCLFFLLVCFWWGKKSCSITYCLA